jgi:hypothetical protein
MVTRAAENPSMTFANRFMFLFLRWES